MGRSAVQSWKSLSAKPLYRFKLPPVSLFCDLEQVSTLTLDPVLKWGWVSIKAVGRND